MNAQENTMVVVLKGEALRLEIQRHQPTLAPDFMIQPNYGRVQVAHPNETSIQMQPRTAIIFFNLVTIAAIHKPCALMAKNY